jgi:hypothetical protein
LIDFIVDEQIELIDLLFDLVNQAAIKPEHGKHHSIVPHDFSR